MRGISGLTYRAYAMTGAAVIAMAVAAPAEAQVRKFNVPAQPAVRGIPEFARQAGLQIIADGNVVRGKTTQAVRGTMPVGVALRQLLDGTGLVASAPGVSGTIIIRNAAQASADSDNQAVQAADQSQIRSDDIVVTARKREESIQSVPIAMSAFKQDDLTRTQVAGGRDLQTQVPNMTFTKTNFTGYSIQIRGIGTQAISATTDAAVAVAFNNTPFIRNRFFEQEFFDVERLEVLRGPQGTLYGRNATAGVVNLISAKPVYRFDAMASVDVGNYDSRRLEGMINIPLVDDKVALRLAGAYTKHSGFVTNELDGKKIDGRDLWSGRATLRLQPTDWLTADLIYEHFSENDDRLRSGKQLCNRDPGATSYGGVPLTGQREGTFGYLPYVSQGCRAASLYSPDSFQVPNGFALPYYGPTSNIGGRVFADRDPYASATQSRDLRVIESALKPEYTAKSNIFEFQLSADLSPSLTLTSETAYSNDKVFSFEDFNRFNTVPGAFRPEEASQRPGVIDDGVFCDPQLGCSDRLLLGDLSTGDAKQFSQELRLASKFDGPFNFNFGANYLRYDTEDKYYVFVNNLSALAALSFGAYGSAPYVPGEATRASPDRVGPGGSARFECLGNLHDSDPDRIYSVENCIYMDPNDIHHLNDQGRNYFLSKNPYKLTSYALFGESYYDITSDLKLTVGLRMTVDRKVAPQIPSWLVAANSYGLPVRKVVDQTWSQPTGRVTLDWSPKTAFSDKSLFYISAARGYKAGGANPPPIVTVTALGSDTESALQSSLTHPETFKAEYINALEFGTKNTFFGGDLTVNLAGFYYDYDGYQISEIVDRSAVNKNYDATIWGAELEADWRPTSNLHFGFKGGFERTRLKKGSRAIDLIDRTAGDPNYAVIKPFPTFPSNCIIPVDYLAKYASGPLLSNSGATGSGICLAAFKEHVDPLTQLPYVPNPTVFANGIPIPGYAGFDPSSVPNNGEGIFKDLSGNELPNAPRFTATISSDLTLPLSAAWNLTLHGDFYMQAKSWARIFNTPGYDRIRPYTNVNLAAMLTNDDAGWSMMAYVKNVFNKDAITGAFLNSDDTGLTTNVFLNEPRLYGLRVTKRFGGSPLGIGGGDISSHKPGTPYPVTIEYGAMLADMVAPNQTWLPPFAAAYDTPDLSFPTANQSAAPHRNLQHSVKLSYAPTPEWVVSGAYRWGRTHGSHRSYGEQETPGSYQDLGFGAPPTYLAGQSNYVDSQVEDRENHDLIDFRVGREVGIGDLKSRIELGVQYAHFKSSTQILANGVPDYYMPAIIKVKYPTAPITNSRFDSAMQAQRSFKGFGPSLSWNASQRLLGKPESGMLSLDLDVTGGLLFGKQKAQVHTTANGVFTSALGFLITQTPINFDPIDSVREKSVTVPTLAVGTGVTYSANNFKISAGYRMDRYFNAIDGGIANRDSRDRTLHGPFIKFSLGFGK